MDKETAKELETQAENMVDEGPNFFLQTPDWSTSLDFFMTVPVTCREVISLLFWMIYGPPKTNGKKKYAAVRITFPP